MLNVSEMLMQYSNGEMAEMSLLQEKYCYAYKTEAKDVPDRFLMDGPKPHHAMPQLADFNKQSWMPRLANKEGQLKNLAEAIVSHICEYQIEREEKRLPLVVRKNDPRTVMLEEMKDWAINTLATANCTSVRTVSEVDSRVRYIESILYCTGMFKSSNRPSFRSTLQDVRDILRNLVLPKITTEMVHASAKDQLELLETKGVESLGHGVQFLFYVFRNTDRAPTDCTISNLRTGRGHASRCLNTASGHLLKALLGTPSFVELFPGQDTSHATSQDIGNWIETVQGPPAVFFDASSTVLVPTAVKYGALDAVAFLKQSNSGFVALSPDLFDLACGMSPAPPTDLSSHARPTRRHVFQLHGMLKLMADLVLSCHRARHLAGPGGDLLLYGAGGGDLRQLLHSWKAVQRKIVQLVSDMTSLAKGELDKLDQNREMSWRACFENAFYLQNAVVYDDIQACESPIQAIESQADPIAVERAKDSFRHGTVTWVQTNQRVCGLVNDAVGIASIPEMYGQPSPEKTVESAPASIGDEATSGTDWPEESPAVSPDESTETSPETHIPDVDARHQSTAPRLVRITVIKANNLAIGDIYSSDPYVVACVGPKYSETTCIAATLNPVWANEVVEFRVTEGEMYSTSVDIYVYDNDMLSDYDFLNVAVMPLAQFEQSKARQHVVCPLAVAPNFANQRTPSVLHLIVEVLDCSCRRVGALWVFFQEGKGQTEIDGHGPNETSWLGSVEKHLSKSKKKVVVVVGLDVFWRCSGISGITKALGFELRSGLLERVPCFNGILPSVTIDGNRRPLSCEASQPIHELLFMTQSSLDTTDVACCAIALGERTFCNMKRNGFDQVAHAQYMASVAARVQAGDDPRTIHSYRKYKYLLHRQSPVAATPATGSTEPLLPPIADEVAASHQSPSASCPEQEQDLAPSDAIVSTSCSEAYDLQARHAYLMELICPALRHTKNISVHAIDTRAADALEQARPCARDGASLTTCGEFLVLFGGCYVSDPAHLHPRTLVPPRQTGKSTVFYSNHVFCYTPESKIWDVPHISGTSPKGRADHSAVYVAATSTLVVFGGRGKHSTVFHDLFCLRVGTTWTWSEPKVSVAIDESVPPPRFWHSAAFDPESNAMFVFGGKDLYSVYGDMRQLQDNRTWSTVTAVGQPPSPRFGATMHWLGPGQVAVVGGWEACSVPLRDNVRWLDVFILDVVAGIWSRPHLSAHFLGRTIPTERMLAATFLLDPTTLVVFGGYTYGPDVNKQDERPWFELEPPPRTVGLPTPARYMHGMKLEPVQDQAIFTLKLDVMVWRRQLQATPLPTSVACGAGAVWRGHGVLAAISVRAPTDMDLVAVVGDTDHSSNALATEGAA